MQGDDGITTEDVDIKDLSLTFTLYSGCSGSGYQGEYSAEVTWEYTPKYYEASGYQPNDYVGIAWDGNSWYYANNNKDDLYDNSQEVNYLSGSSSQGPGWEIDDTDAIYDSWNSDKIFYAGVYMDWKGSDRSVKTLAASYSHTYSGVKITSVGVSYPSGITVSVSNESNKYTKDTNDDGDFLKLSNNEAEGCF
jgi:hypothetical protein